MICFSIQLQIQEIEKEILTLPKKCCIKAKAFESERVHMCMESGIRNLLETPLKILSKQVIVLKFLGDYSLKIQLSCSSSCYYH